MAASKLAGEKIAKVEKRLKAFLFDYLLIFIYIILLTGGNFGLILATGTLDKISPFFASPVGKDLIAFLTLVLPVILYFSLQESSPSGATWGKRKVGLMVVDEKGEKLSFGKAFLRSAIKFIPWQVAHTSIYQLYTASQNDEQPTLGTVGIILTYLLVGLYLAAALISKQNRTPYDWAAGFFVIEY